MKYTITSEFNCKEPMLGERSSILPWQEATQNRRYPTGPIIFTYEGIYSRILQTIKYLKIKILSSKCFIFIKFWYYICKIQRFLPFNISEPDKKNTPQLLYIITIIMIMSNFQDNYIRVRIIWFHIILHYMDT